MFKLLAFAVAGCQFVAAQTPVLSVEAQQYELRVLENELGGVLARYTPGNPAIRLVEELIVHADAQLRQNAKPVVVRDLGVRTIEALRRDLAKMQTEYAPSHPEVLRLQALIAQLERTSTDRQ